MRRRSTRACCVRAPCRAGCGRLIPHERNLRWREASLHRRATVVQRDSYGVRRQASSARIAQRTRAGARCLWEGDAALELAACARNTVLIVVGPCPVEGHCADERPFSICACLWCDVPAAVSNAKPAPLVTRRTRAVACCLWGGGAALEIAVRACRAALVVIAADATTKEQRRREASLPPRAPVVQRASTASNAKPAPLVTRRTRAISRYIFGEAQHSSLLRSRAVPRWL